MKLKRVKKLSKKGEGVYIEATRGDWELVHISWREKCISDYPYFRVTDGMNKRYLDKNKIYGPIELDNS